jgi:hypothetical protein
MSFDAHAPSAETADNSFWSVLREAVVGSGRDFTQGSLGIAIFILAVPMIIEMMAESLFAIVDIFFVSRLGSGAVAVVSITESMMYLIYSVAIGLSIGATATVARRIGEKDREGAATAATHSIYLGALASLVLGVIGVVFAPTFLRLMGADETVVAEGTPFTRIMLGGNIVVMFLFMLNAIFRGAGDAAIAMRVLWFANIMNIILAPCFIFGLWFFPELGVTGAAVGTTVGRGLGVLYAAYKLFFGEKTIHHSRLSLESRYDEIVETDQSVGSRRPAVLHPDSKLDRPRSSGYRVWDPGDRRLPDSDPCSDLCLAAIGRPGECRRNVGWSESWGGKTGALREGSLDRGFLQCDRSNFDRDPVRGFCRADRRRICNGTR